MDAAGKCGGSDIVSSASATSALALGTGACDQLLIRNQTQTTEAPSVCNGVDRGGVGGGDDEGEGKGAERGHSGGVVDCNSSDKTAARLYNGLKPKSHTASNAACENLDLIKCFIRDELFNSGEPTETDFLSTPDLVNGSFSCCVNNNNNNNKSYNNSNSSLNSSSDSCINGSLDGSFTSCANNNSGVNNNSSFNSCLNNNSSSNSSLSSCVSSNNIGAKEKRRNVSVININYNERDLRDSQPSDRGSADQSDHPDLVHSHPQLDGEPDGPVRNDGSTPPGSPERGAAHFQSDSSRDLRCPQTAHMNGGLSVGHHNDVTVEGEISGDLVSHVYTNGVSNNINIDVPSGECSVGADPQGDDDDDESFNSCSGSVSSMLDDDVIDSILTEEEKSARGGTDPDPGPGGAKNPGEEVWSPQNENTSLESDLIVDFLDKSNNHAEARLAARRQARAEAREIRMRELERQQREAEENADRVFDLYATQDSMNRTNRVVSNIASPRSASVLSTGGGNNSYHSSRRSSEDSLEDSIGVRDIRHELRELEDKFRKAMIQNAQLDNEKSAASYQVELFKDKFEELEESHAQLQREHRDKCREHEQLKRLFTKIQGELEFFRLQLEERDSLIKDQGLVIVGGEYSSEDEKSDEGPREVNGLENGSIGTCNSLHNHNEKKKTKKLAKRALVSVQSAELLEKAGEGSLDVRLRKLAEERNELLDELRHVKLELEEERGRSRGHKNINGTDGGSDFEDVQREANKLLGEYKFKWQKAEQDVSTLQANVARLESQVIRYKSAAETSEKVEDELKVEKRKLQRELREAQSRVEELETSNMHLQRRLDKLKNAKSTLLKEL